MPKAIWFSRHAPTQAQKEDALIRWGAEIIINDDLTALASRTLETESDLGEVFEAIIATVEKFSAIVVLGVFPAPIQEYLTSNAGDTGTPCYSAWNRTRPQEGGPPTFEHIRFCYVGNL